jgi:hypothetical protein
VALGTTVVAGPLQLLLPGTTPISFGLVFCAASNRSGVGITISAVVGACRSEDLLHCHR